MTCKSLTLSIVLPVYNEQYHLKACLDAIAAQSVKPDEVIVVDNNSTDLSLNIARRYSFVKVIHEPTQGVLSARNRGFNAAKSDIIGRIDADTILDHDWIKNVKKIFAGTDLAAVTGPVSYYDMPLPSINCLPDHWMRASLYAWSPKSPFLFGSNMAIRRSAWRQFRYSICSRTDIHEDLDLAVHLYQAGCNTMYSKTLLSEASGRRYNDAPKKFYSYMSMYRKTYLCHGIHSWASYAAVAVYWLGYGLVHPWISISSKLRFLDKSLRNVPRVSRKNPMASQ